jgi:hypothetical protein
MPGIEVALIGGAVAVVGFAFEKTAEVNGASANSTQKNKKIMADQVKGETSNAVLNSVEKDPHTIHNPKVK